MNRKTATYVLLIIAVLACGPCITEADLGEIQTAVAQQSQSTQVAEAVQETLDAIATVPIGPTAEPEQDTPATGTVTGHIGFPSEGVPAVTIYAQNVADNSWVSLSYPGGWGEYTFSGIPPGDYVFFAYMDDPTKNFGGGYTAYVTCGLTAECTDHSLLLVHIEPGATVEGINISDWYGPEGFLPPRP